ncbi:MAG: UbiX family flavin prenyltransferase [Chitinophagales bacterium]|nr:UbiX family flavin prenyltransferase [Chitinophagales bacterium]HMV14797.1 UbiX family flavin prenyltransferase [Chitinophagales bacterium]HMW13271.1 UbiX family flavin prenyltransferase [Chitinophagales bacterium]HMX60825.1 UbiX family flavin prenyltransferase [Chitinophagales bacterium]HMY22641.1 UbiX family flavin prenyltransferase [Chitinophagales bacterium]
MERKIIVAVSGASGSIYTKVLFDKLLHIKQQVSKVGVVMSDNAKDVWKFELGNEDYTSYPFDFYAKNDFMAPFASGSAKYDTMIVCPCSMGTLGRIAGGISNDLTTRAADVMLKERRKLILVTRETPLHLIHINNMKIVTESGGIICPATPSFYSLPNSFEQLAATVIDRVIDLCGFENNSYRWRE